MKKILLPIFATAVVIIVLGLVTQGFQGKSPLPFLNFKLPSTNQTERTVVIKGNTVKVDVADTDSERRRGLSGRESLPEDEGVLFIFPKQNVITPFWMKDMKIAIDIIWINDGVIVQIDREVSPEPGVADNKLKLYQPTTPIDYVLEVNSGWAKRHDVLVGEKVELHI